MSNATWFKEIFLKHLKYAKTVRASFSEFIVSMFRLKVRSIDTMKCITSHELRGALWVDSKPIEGLIDRRVLNMKAGQTVWIRDDVDEPYITLENSRGCVNIRKNDWKYKYARYYK